MLGKVTVLRRRTQSYCKHLKKIIWIQCFQRGGTSTASTVKVPKRSETNMIIVFQWYLNFWKSTLRGDVRTEAVCKVCISHRAYLITLTLYVLNKYTHLKKNFACSNCSITVPSQHSWGQELYPFNLSQSLSSPALFISFWQWWFFLLAKNLCAKEIRWIHNYLFCGISNKKRKEEKEGHSNYQAFSFSNFQSFFTATTSCTNTPSILYNPRYFFFLTRYQKPELMKTLLLMLLMFSFVLVIGTEM